MDLKQYYRKIHDTEGGLAEPYIFVTSLETADGGKAGLVSEVSRPIAAKMLVEGRAVLATEAQKQAYLVQQTAAKQAAHKAELAKRVQMTILTDSDLDTTAEKNSGGK